MLIRSPSPARERQTRRARTPVRDDANANVLRERAEPCGHLDEVPVSLVREEMAHRANLVRWPTRGSGRVVRMAFPIVNSSETAPFD
jgi:hypothetical protein